jgi:hexosaminidase
MDQVPVTNDERLAEIAPQTAEVDGREWELPDAHHALMPVPAFLRFSPGRLKVDGAFSIALDEVASPWLSRDGRLLAALQRTARRIEMRTAVEISRSWWSPPASASLVVRAESPGSGVPSLHESEAYSLSVSPTQATLAAPCTLGILRGLETVLQLLTSDGEEFFLPALLVEDRPRFPWRGLLIDVSRHWMPMEVIERNTDGMAAVKLNVLHLHLTDDQGFRIESREFPSLHELGSDGLYYTQEQIRRIVAYAHDRGIRVVPEFDMPAHVTSWLVAHPELACVPARYRLERAYDQFDATLDPTREEVYCFLDRFLGEMAALFPDEYMHVGGDNHHGKQWKDSAVVQAWTSSRGLAADDVKSVHAYFSRRIEGILQRHGKKMIGWADSLHPDLPRSVTLQCWGAMKSLRETVKHGHPAVVSLGYFLDYYQPASAAYAVDPLAPGEGLNADEAALILGGEACMWTELVTPENVDSRIWPRLAAIAERFWSSAATIDVDDMYRRLARVSVRLEEHGLLHERNSDVALRRLADTNGDDIDALRTFVSVLEPVAQLRPLTQLTPLTRVIDAALPDSLAARRFEALVRSHLGAAPAFELHHDALAATLERWRALPQSLSRILSRSPLLRAVAPFAADLADVAALGMAALSCLTSGTSPTREWADAAVSRLTAIARRDPELRLAIVPAVRLLAFAAVHLTDLWTVPSSSWVARVEQLAASSDRTAS